MTPSFTVAVGGDPAAIRSAADWLRNKAEATAKEADTVSGDDAVNTSTYWEGESAAAFTDISYDLVEAAREIAAIAGPFAEKMHIFAGKIERMREHFEGFLKHAESIGLRVQGTEVYRSVWHGEVPQVTSDPRWDEWRAHQHRERDYGRIQRDVVDWHADLEVWIAQNLITDAAALPPEAKAEAVQKKLREGANSLIQAGSSYLTTTWINTIQDLQLDAREYREIAAELVRKSGVTGDPALRARLKDAIEAGMPDGLKTRAAAAENFSDVLTTSRRILEVGGVAADVMFAGWDIAEGAKPLDSAVALGGGMAGAAVGGWVAGALLVSTGWAVVLGGGAALGIGKLIEAGWEGISPSWREGIYEWMEDGFIVAGDVGEAVGDWFYDAWVTVSHSG